MSVFFVSVSSTNAFLEVYGVLFKSVFENLAVGGERVQWKVVGENSPHMGRVIPVVALFRSVFS